MDDDVGEDEDGTWPKCSGCDPFEAELGPGTKNVNSSSSIINMDEDEEDGDVVDSTFAHLEKIGADAIKYLGARPKK